MFEKEVEIRNNLGLFARPAMFFIQKANEFRSTVFIKIDEKIVNAKSLLGVLSLGAAKGQKIIIRADGSDEKEAVFSLMELVESCFAKCEIVDDDM
jgi:phosphocarrier protein